MLAGQTTHTHRPQPLYAKATAAIQAETGVRMGADKNLSIPPVAQRDKASFEVMRVWIAEQGQHVSIRSGAWEDPFAWGIVLADLARHIAHAHQLQNEGTDTDAFLQRLLEGFQAEIDNPTDEPEGEVTQ